jgi:hypothetical protein
MHTPVIPALGRQRQDEREFQVSLNYLERPCLKKKKFVQSSVNVD